MSLQRSVEVAVASAIERSDGVAEIPLDGTGPCLPGAPAARSGGMRRSCTSRSAGEGGCLGWIVSSLDFLGFSFPFLALSFFFLGRNGGASQNVSEGRGASPGSLRAGGCPFVGRDGHGEALRLVDEIQSRGIGRVARCLGRLLLSLRSQNYCDKF